MSNYSHGSMYGGYGGYGYGFGGGYGGGCCYQVMAVDTDTAADVHSL